MSTDQPSVPAQGTTNKLQLENQSLKRRLVQYAATLEKLTTHAKREIDQSTRARDEALSRAADASALRQKLSEMNASLTSAQSARDNANASLHRAEARVEQLQATLASLQRRLDDARYDDTHVASMREELHALRKELPSLRRLREQDASRANTLNEQLEVEKQKSATYDSMILRMQQLQTENSQLVTDRDASEMAVSNMRRSETAATRERDDLIVKLRESQDMNDMLRQQLDQLQDRVRLLEQRLKDAEATELRYEKDAADAKKQSEDAVAALRRELDSALKDLGDRNTLYEELKEKHDRSIDAESALAERDSMQSNIQQLQVELDQSTEMLTRAAIDALADKGKIRKLEDAISKLRGEAEGERKEKSTLETRIVNLTQQIATLEGELDQVRTSKRELADECHKYQLQIHERDSVVASKNRALEELDTDRNDRAFRIDRLKLELSNSKNALAKKESDLVKITTEYEDMCTVLKSTNKDLDDKHGEVTRARREITALNDQISKVTQERDHLKVTVAELQVASRQVEELSALVNSKDEEIGSMKRWCTSLKAEAGESVREKKRLSDMLSDVSGDLKRANQELELLRNMRQEQEMLAQRISQISETSSRELSDMRKSQSEQAEVLAKSTVEAYQGRIMEMQKSARHEIADTVTTQLRDDIMPHLMRAVDAKARNLVHALAKHVESFTVDDGASYDFVKETLPKPSTKVEVGTAASVERSTEYATSHTASRSVSLTAAPSFPVSESRNAHPLSVTESPPISVANASHGDYTGIETTAEPSTVTSDRSIEVARSFAEPLSSPTPASSAPGVPSEPVEGADMIDDIDPVAIHQRLTETYKQLLGGRTDLDLVEFQTSSEVVEMNVTSRQVTSVSVEPTALEESKEVTSEALIVEEAAPATRDIPTVTMEKLEVPKPKNSEEELEIVESYVPKEGEIDESFEDGEEETEEDAPEAEGPAATGEPTDDTVEEFQDALADVVHEPPVTDSATEAAKNIVPEEGVGNTVAEEGGVEQSEVITREFPVPQVESEDKDIGPETTAQTETEETPPQASEAEAPALESAPIPVEIPAPSDPIQPEESVQPAGTALEANTEEVLGGDAPVPVEETEGVDPVVEAEVGFHEESREPAELEEGAKVEATEASRDFQITAPESGERVGDTRDTADGTKQDHEEEKAENISTIRQEVSEVFPDAPRETEVALDDAPKEKTDTAEAEKEDSELLQEVAPGAEEAVPEPQEVEEAAEVGDEEHDHHDDAMLTAEEHVPEEADALEAEGDEPLDIAMPVTAGHVPQEVDDVESVEETVDNITPKGRHVDVMPALEHGSQEVDDVEPAEETTDDIAPKELHEEVVLAAERGLEPDNRVSDEYQEGDQPSTEEVDEHEPEEVDNALNAPERDVDGGEEHGEQEPVQNLIQSRDVPIQEDKTSLVEEDDVAVDAAPEIAHEHIPGRAAEPFVDDSHSGLPSEDVESSAVENVDDMGDDRKPRELDLSAPTGVVSDDTPVTAEVQHPVPIEEVTEPTSGVETIDEGHAAEADAEAETQEEPSESREDTPLNLASLTPAQLLETSHESQPDTGLDLSSGYEEAILAHGNIDSNVTEEAVQGEVTASSHPDFPSQIDEGVAHGEGAHEQEGHGLEDADDQHGITEESLHPPAFAEEEVNEADVVTPAEAEEEIDVDEHMPLGDEQELNTGNKGEGEDVSAAVGVAQWNEESDGEEYIEEVDATRDDYGAEVELETEPPVMAFATLNVVEEDVLLDDDEDDDCEEDDEELDEEYRADVQDRIDELDLTEGVPADLDDHSDLDEFEDAVQHDGVYDHAVVEELLDNEEGEELSTALDQDGAHPEAAEQVMHEHVEETAERKEEEAHSTLAEAQQSASTKPFHEMTEEEKSTALKAEAQHVAEEIGSAAITGGREGPVPVMNELNADDSIGGESSLPA
eukprot:TRINITY_DN541_c0_g1_i1.p1 TRINITY_DN541_c0_g1~~TRINITY_DN541_c0_g1_i1.p1  ORF type:complete len:1927 (+),score=472.59 TRINITY_DN541_c0_g1_i1:789-6569(+)